MITYIIKTNHALFESQWDDYNVVAWYPNKIEPTNDEDIDEESRKSNICISQWKLIIVGTIIIVIVFWSFVTSIKF